MKLILAILSNEDSSTASRALTEKKFQVTKLNTTGGFLRAGNTTLMIGCEDEDVQEAIELIKESSRKRS
ncbi:cyclic-di-AMP receptor, partial [Dubosiella newyorkensis]